MLTIVINYVCDCTIWGYYPLGIPAVLTAQYIILNLTKYTFAPYKYYANIFMHKNTVHGMIINSLTLLMVHKNYTNEELSTDHNGTLGCVNITML